MPGRSLSTPEAPKERYTGHEYDDETETDGLTGLYYAGARYYDPMIARWPTVDPLDDLYPDHSPYNYALNNPLSFADLTGLCPEGVKGGETFVDENTGETIVCLAAVDEVVVEEERSRGSSAEPVGGFFSMLLHRFVRDSANLEEGGKGHPRRATSYEYAGGQYWRVVDSLNWVRPPADFILAPSVVVGSSALQKAVNYVMGNPTKINHIFGKATHKLGPLVAKLGSQRKAIEKTLDALNSTGLLPAAGKFEINVLVAGENVTVRGFMHGGVPKIGTMFVP